MIVLPSQRNAQVIRDRLMNRTPPSLRSSIVVDMRLRLEKVTALPKPVLPQKIFSIMRMPTAEELAAMPNWRQITFQVALKHNVTVADILSRMRDAPIVKARYEAMWRLSTEGGLSTTQIGRFFKRDHTTALHGIRKHQWRLDQETAK